MGFPPNVSRLIMALSVLGFPLLLVRAEDSLIAKELSGGYHNIDIDSLVGMPPSNAGKTACPKNLRVAVSHSYGTTYKFSFPESLMDPSGTCKPSIGFRRIYKHMNNYSKILGALLGYLTKDQIPAMKVLIVGLVPEDLLVCNENSSKTFKSIVIVSLKDPTVQMLGFFFRRLGNSTDSLENALRSEQGESSGVHTALSELGKSYILFLLRDRIKLSNAYSLLAQFAGEGTQGKLPRDAHLFEGMCSYIGGEISLRYTLNNIVNLIAALSHVN